MTRTGRILAVDDGDLGRTLIRTLLTRAADPTLRAAELVEAGTLAEARRHLAADRFDVVLLDMRLPDGEGLSLLDALPAGPDSHRPAVVALTGDTSSPARTRALEAGCDEFLTKPFRAAELLDVVARYLPTAGPESDGGGISQNG